MYKIKELNLHITQYCSGSCPMCYATDEKMKRTHGDLETLKKIVHNAIKYGEIERFVMVGGDPCEHPHLIELLRYIKEEGLQYNINTKSIVISNTHDYRENGIIVPIENISSLLYGMCATVHSDNAEEHDLFNKCDGSFEHMLNNLKLFARQKASEQEICIIANLMPETIPKLKNIMFNINEKLGGKVDGFAIQRIAPIGRAASSSRFFIKKEDINTVLKICDEMKKYNGFFIEMVDTFPFCLADPKYWYLLPQGGCIWGKWCCACYSDGTIARCAMSHNKLSKNILELNTKQKFQDFWEKDKDLINFRNHKHLDKKCTRCEMLEKCGGGCVLARTGGDPYKNDQIEIGCDYLRKN